MACEAFILPEFSGDIAECRGGYYHVYMSRDTRPTSCDTRPSSRDKGMVVTSPNHTRTLTPPPREAWFFRGICSLGILYSVQFSIICGNPPLELMVQRSLYNWVEDNSTLGERTIV